MFHTIQMSATALSMLRKNNNNTSHPPPPPIIYTETTSHSSQMTHSAGLVSSNHAEVGLVSSNSLTPFIPYPVPRYIHKYPQIYEAVQSVHQIISEWAPETPQGAYELECRFGVWKGQYFQSGVSKAFVEKILAMFETFTQWSKVSDWEETHNYFYADQDSSLPMVRTTASFQTDPKTGRKRIVTEHIRKYPRTKMDFQYLTIGGNGGIFSDGTDFHYDIRVCLNYEEKVSDQDLPSIVNPSSVRIKSRKSFYYKSEEFPSAEPLWRFDITRSWDGVSRSDAEMKQRNGNTTFEVELECLNPRALMVSPKHDTFYVACSMLLKMKDFLSSATTCASDFKWDPIQKPAAMSDVECF